MAEDRPARGDTRPRSTDQQRQPSGADVGWGITGTMLSGIIVWGGVGLLLDRWWETRFLALVGTILGLTVAIYLIVVKYGAVDPPAKSSRRPGTTPAERRPSGPHGQTQKGQR
ncbi:AtpZ/AtpI family protein [Blastococcus sp. PRF04-17]|uniref:AtpZ/AtpI family protein n=1 Tax=Blastococcus sp. PRF04-17 TaxID=2933797 RepID=UPI001FF35175|nr:AtpZ/AtpI family protein [Blastococcus sp. PRF04-17]UOY01396.1 hypothetical protein MVA48_21025 [Blastococcus sp. PRF04-17]